MIGKDHVPGPVEGTLFGARPTENNGILSEFRLLSVRCFLPRTKILYTVQEGNKMNGAIGRLRIREQTKLD